MKADMGFLRGCMKADMGFLRCCIKADMGLLGLVARMSDHVADLVCVYIVLIGS